MPCKMNRVLANFRAVTKIIAYSKHCNGHRRVCSCINHRRDYSSGARCHADAFNQSINNPEEFWAEAAEGIIWHKKWDKVLDNSQQPFTKWFVGGELNTCYNAVDRHVEQGNGDHTAIIFDSPITKQISRLTYRELQQEVSRFAGVLQTYGVKKGDRVLIYMPMIPEAIIAMLGTVRLGAIHSLVFGGFAAKELSVRIEHAKPKVVVSANCGVEPGREVPYKPMLDEALALCDFKPKHCIIYNRPKFTLASLTPVRDLDWSLEMSYAKPVDCVPVGAMDPVYILYTSGTTGLPKAVVRPSGGHAVVLNWSMWNIYGLKPKEVWWAASDLGWVVGHSYICYSPLLNCNTTVLYEGKPVGTPDPGVYFRVLKEHDVASMFVAPTAIRAILREDPEAKYAQKFLPLDKLSPGEKVTYEEVICNLFSRFRALFVAGEHCDKETMEWARYALSSPILDNWWQTETGWAITSTCVGLNMALRPPTGASGKAVPGWNVKVLTKDGSEAKPMELGDIVVKLPLPPGAFSSLWENEERFKDTYFKSKPGYYDTMDAGYMDEEGHVFVMSRSDDVINVADHRLSTGSLEEAIISSDDIAEAAVVGIPDQLKGQVPLGLCVLKYGVEKPHEDVIKDVINIVRTNIGPVASFKLVVIVPKLPKTRSGKIARNTITAMAAGKPFKIPVTIEDASVYPAIKQALQSLGFATDPPLS